MKDKNRVTTSYNITNGILSMQEIEEVWDSLSEAHKAAVLLYCTCDCDFVTAKWSTLTDNQKMRAIQKQILPVPFLSTVWRELPNFLRTDIVKR